MPLAIARAIIATLELYVLAGVIFAAAFLPRAVARLDPRVGGAPRTLRLLILPGTVVLWAVVCAAMAPPCRRAG
jgi:hypothetical protein